MWWLENDIHTHRTLSHKPNQPQCWYFQYHVNYSPYTCYAYMVVNIFLSNLCLTQFRPCSLVLPLSPTLLYGHAHANAHICALIPCDDNDHCDFKMKDTCTKDSCIKRQCFWGASTDLLDKASHLIVFCPWDSSPYLPVTPAQVIRPGIGRNASCTVGNLG